MHNLQADALYLTSIGSNKPKFARSTSELLLEGCSWKGYKTLVQPNFQYIPTWKEDPKKVRDVTDKAAKEWAFVEEEFRDRAREESLAKAGSSSERETGRSGQKQEEERPRRFES